MIRDRAARLRAAGEAALARHLAAQVGQTHRVLMEGPRMGRTEQFTEVDLRRPISPKGSIVTARHHRLAVTAGEGGLRGSCSTGCRALAADGVARVAASGTVRSPRRP